MWTRCLCGFSVMWVTKLLISPVKIRIFCSKTSKFGLKLAFLPGLVGLFGALLVGWLVVVARGLHLARHLLTLYFSTWTGLLRVGRVGEKSLKTDLTVTKNFLVMVISQFLRNKVRNAFISGNRIRGYWKLQSYLHLYKSLIPLYATKPTIFYSSYLVYTKGGLQKLLSGICPLRGYPLLPP